MDNHILAGLIAYSSTLGPITDQIWLNMEKAFINLWMLEEGMLQSENI